MFNVERTIKVWLQLDLEQNGKKCAVALDSVMYMKETKDNDNKDITDVFINNEKGSVLTVKQTVNEILDMMEQANKKNL